MLLPVQNMWFKLYIRLKRGNQMKKFLTVLTSFLCSVFLLTGCESAEPFEEQHKNETETVTVSNGAMLKFSILSRASSTDKSPIFISFQPRYFLYF